MKTYLYEAFDEIIADEELGEYRTYGINLTSDEGVMSIRDISLCKETVLTTVARFNQHQLQGVHFRDAVEDLLAR